MQPTFHTGERLSINHLPALQFARGPLGQLGGLLSHQRIASSLFSAPRTGDIVVFDPPVPSTDDYIKRVIGQPGDHVAIVAGDVYVNGARFSDPYLHVTSTLCSGRWCDVQLGDEEYYVLGDNRPDSSDSRAWGPVTADRIAGTAWLVYYPLKDAGIAR